jgi:hypothetical protein
LFIAPPFLAARSAKADQRNGFNPERRKHQRDGVAVQSTDRNEAGSSVACWTRRLDHGLLEGETISGRCKIKVMPPQANLPFRSSQMTSMRSLHQK